MLVGAAMCPACLCGADLWPPAAPERERGELALMLSADRVPVKARSLVAALAKMGQVWGGHAAHEGHPFGSPLQARGRLFHGARQNSSLGGGLFGSLWVPALSLQRLHETD